jgi:hypothetical protein
MSRAPNFLTAVLAGVWAGIGALTINAWVRYLMGHSGTLGVPFIIGCVVVFVLFVQLPVSFLVFDQRKGESGTKRLWNGRLRWLSWLAVFLTVYFGGVPLLDALYAS